MALRRLARIIRQNATASIAAAAALVTMLFVPPDAAYLGYFDLNTLACLFALLAVIRALRNAGFFETIAHAVVRRFKTLRGLGCALVGVTLVCSMFATNDMALLMLLPLSTVTLASTGNERALPFTFVMQAIAANLGGMILPFGNPQNIFLNSRFGIAFPDFLATMALPFAVSVILIALCCLAGFKATPLSSSGVPDADASERAPLPRAKTALYLVLFALSLGMVFRVVPFVAGVVIIAAALLFADRRALAHVDWGLLATFALFFVFSGNMARIPEVQGFFSMLLGQSTLVTSALASQVISNVPAAILLAPFVDGYQSLLIGVNIGGAGTLIASLASLIAFNHFRAIKRGMKRPGIQALSTKRYLALFSALNFAFLAVLLAVCLAAGF
ncbi:MAG: SLC13 family permease [Eggerthellaceae bacterium]